MNEKTTPIKNKITIFCMELSTTEGLLKVINKRNNPTNVKTKLESLSIICFESFSSVSSFSEELLNKLIISSTTPTASKIFQDISLFIL